MAAVISSQTKPRLPANPVEILNNDAARFYTHLHPVLVLSLYAYGFQSVVADPVPALTSSLIPLSILQIAYVAICLPPIGGSGSAAAQADKRKPGEKKKTAPGKLETRVNGKIIVHLHTLCGL